jgi:4-hydroxy-tetrahydrodipicolinate synthase
MSEHPWTGVIAAPFLPFENDLSIDWRTLEAYIGEIAAARPRAIAMNMSASEGYSLDADEHAEVIRVCKRAVQGACPILSGVLSSHNAGARDAARRMVDAGADGIVVFPPLPISLFKPVPVQMIIDFHAAVTEAVDKPVFAFQTPTSPYPAGTVAALSRLPGMVGIKDAGFSVEGTWNTIEEARKAGGSLAVLTGSDTFILEAMLMGCDGALIGFAGTATAELVRMHELARANDVGAAYEIWRRLAPLAQVCWRAPLINYRVRVKYVLMQQGIFPNALARPPQPPLEDHDRADLDLLFERHSYGDMRYRPAPGFPGLRATSKGLAAE